METESNSSILAKIGSSAVLITTVCSVVLYVIGVSNYSVFVENLGFDLGQFSIPVFGMMLAAFNEGFLTVILLFMFAITWRFRLAMIAAYFFVLAVPVVFAIKLLALVWKALKWVLEGAFEWLFEKQLKIDVSKYRKQTKRFFSDKMGPIFRAVCVPLFWLGEVFKWAWELAGSYVADERKRSSDAYKSIIRDDFTAIGLCGASIVLFGYLVISAGKRGRESAVEFESTVMERPVEVVYSDKSFVKGYHVCTVGDFEILDVPSEDGTRRTLVSRKDIRTFTKLETEPATEEKELTKSDD